MDDSYECTAELKKSDVVRFYLYKVKKETQQNLSLVLKVKIVMAFGKVGREVIGREHEVDAFGVLMVFLQIGSL